MIPTRVERSPLPGPVTSGLSTHQCDKLLASMDRIAKATESAASTLEKMWGDQCGAAPSCPASSQALSAIMRSVSAIQSSSTFHDVYNTSLLETMKRQLEEHMDHMDPERRVRPRTEPPVSVESTDFPATLASGEDDLEEESQRPGASGEDESQRPEATYYRRRPGSL